MARVDLFCRYTAFPNKPTVLAPHKEIWLPVLEVALVLGGQAIRQAALVDSGASMTLFGLGAADALGFDWRAAPSVEFRGVGSTGNVGYVADVQLGLPDAGFSWPARIAFCNASDIYGLAFLGYLGFFDTFQVKLRGPSKDFSVFLR